MGEVETALNAVIAFCYSVRPDKSMVARSTKKVDRALPISDQNRLYPKALKHLGLEDKRREEKEKFKQSILRQLPIK